MMKDNLKTALQWALSKDKGLLAMNASLDDLTAIYPYHDQGQEVFIKARFDKDGQKWIKPFFFDGQNYKMGEPKAYKDGKPKPLYLPAPLGDVVYIVEGEKCVHRLLDIGLSATTTGGATSIDKCDLTPLLGCKCVLWRDNDKSGQKWQDELITALERLTIAFEVIDIAGMTLADGTPMPDKGDCFDFVESHLADGNEYADIIALIEQLPRLDLSQQQDCNKGNGGSDEAELAKSMLQAKKAELQQAIAMLASLEPMELDLSLRKTSNEFGITQKKILEYVTNHKQGELIPSTKPHHEPVTGQEIYKELYALIDDFMVIDEPLKVAFVLWVIFTYLLDIAEYAPLVWITSPEKQCGKSTLLTLFASVADKAITANSITPSAVNRVMDKYRPCLLIDEIDANLKKDSDIWGVINGGHSRMADKRIVCDPDNGNALVAFSAFGAKVVCGIGANLPSATISRSIRFVLTRKEQGDINTKRCVHKNLANAQPDLLKSKIKRWAIDNQSKVESVDIPIFDINDRDFDNWYILLQIASVLGVYDVAMGACLELCKQEREPTQNERLLSNIREVMTKKPKLKSDWLLDELISNTSWEWANYNGHNTPMNKYQLLQKLKAFKITQRPINDGNQRYKGYHLEHLTPIFNRYLPAMTLSDDSPFDDD